MRDQPEIEAFDRYAHGGTINFTLHEFGGKLIGQNVNLTPKQFGRKLGDIFELWVRA